MADCIKELIEGCKKQNSGAQQQFYSTFYKMVYNCCFRILWNNEDAEDCMLETFIKAFTKIETLGEVPVEAWLRRIAINTAIDKLKKHKVNFMNTYLFTKKRLLTKKK